MFSRPSETSSRAAQTDAWERSAASQGQRRWPQEACKRILNSNHVTASVFHMHLPWPHICPAGLSICQEITWGGQFATRSHTAEVSTAEKAPNCARLAPAVSSSRTYCNRFPRLNTSLEKSSATFHWLYISLLLSVLERQIHVQREPFDERYRIKYEACIWLLSESGFSILLMRLYLAVLSKKVCRNRQNYFQ